MCVICLLWLMLVGCCFKVGLIVMFGWLVGSVCCSWCYWMRVMCHVNSVVVRVLIGVI